MEANAGLSRGSRLTATSFAVGLLCVLLATANGAPLVESDRQHAFDLFQQIIDHGGNPVQLLQAELDLLRNGKPQDGGHLSAHDDGLQHSAYSYPTKEAHDQLNPAAAAVLDIQDDDDLDNDPRVELLPATATAGAGAAGAYAYAGANHHGLEEVYLDEQHLGHPYHQAVETSARSGEPMLHKTTFSVDPVTGEETRHTVIENSPWVPGKPKVVSMITSSTSADGTKRSSSSFTRTSSFSSSSSATPSAAISASSVAGQDAHLDVLAPDSEASVSHNASTDGFEFGELHDDLDNELENKFDQNQDQDQEVQSQQLPSLPTDDQNQAPQSPLVASDAATTIPQQQAQPPSTSEDGNYHDSIMIDQDHGSEEGANHDGQSTGPQEEHFEETYIDRSDPLDPKEVHVEKQTKSVVGPNGTSHEHHETQTSTSLGDKNSSSHHSKSSYSASSTSSSSKNSSSRRHKSKRQQQVVSQQTRRNNNANGSFEMPPMPPMPPMPLMSLHPITVMPYGVPSWPHMFMNHNQMAVAAAGPFGFAQYPYPIDSLAPSGSRFAQRKGKKQAKKARKAQRKAAAAAKKALSSG